MKVKSCGIIPVLKQNNKIKFLLIQHQAGHWAFPKGGVEQGETEAETAKRELREETGIKDFKTLNDIYFTEKYSFEKDGKKYDKMVKYFLAWVRNSEVKLLKSELQNYRWLEYAEAIKLITYEDAKNILRQVNKYLIQ
ncbi:NUDIX hydrolase [Candidatus Kuenenbacteria bacterium CG_4_9_14_3_um_filter_39_14]|uniref:Bis(5'-nucleosyl)-tetraphosphatase [asymmetrical] n=6 Tax=Candidatus Kueneniibacteriota TaxID=1752740 RepID=A0A2M7IM08_9BACT|nr:NUDIX domain-containing protein [Candidatus Kuenenbacteria bacterium]PIP28989.1 MAG: NUDIX hydrolase [Candidatus Kuenenbacteria bacterium CG23_combo_of_CG06-09_8_20_14_all_39_39]PIP76011.1 MAG: NUDIX hydrolase [Candidatus Kuenenbacteria bacterium CG22_combo_CG10-13_8_21_14_all_39_9]PIR80923.1 MAG: NUDIX hydrolase [Candidatus Kuenenbacteria bacterium CG10_big_fil_rev_8_21_14_0_10_39_14]PIW95820.1 MAG: NUDIX hydrolase [Candidatus Kuenenbacteria bacterium CG_4_8_14_3_um_filter_39_15]PIX92338.1